MISSTPNPKNQFPKLEPCKECNQMPSVGLVLSLALSTSSPGGVTVREAIRCPACGKAAIVEKGMVADLATATFATVRPEVFACIVEKWNRINAQTD